MSFAVILFAGAAAITASGAIGVVASRSVVRAAVWLLISLIGVSLLYFLLGAEFLGAAQLIVYVGGTMVLVVFGVMMTSQGPFDGFRPRRLEWLVGGIVALGLFLTLVNVSLEFGRVPVSSNQPLPSAGPLGQSFLGVPEADRPKQTTFLLPFEIVSIHLLVVLVAAAYLARSKRRSNPSANANPIGMTSAAPTP
jgi:NADH-quinone oxidoreductase subunit J